MSDEWLSQWSRSKQFVMSRQVLDCCALVVKSNVTDWGQNHFVHLMCDNSRKDSKRWLEKHGKSPHHVEIVWKV